MQFPILNSLVLPYVLRLKSKFTVVYALPRLISHHSSPAAGGSISTFRSQPKNHFFREAPFLASSPKWASPRGFLSFPHLSWSLIPFNFLKIIVVFVVVVVVSCSNSHCSLAICPASLCTSWGLYTGITPVPGVIFVKMKEPAVWREKQWNHRARVRVGYSMFWCWMPAWSCRWGESRRAQGRALLMNRVWNW